jgi:hypothetical protein
MGSVKPSTSVAHSLPSQHSRTGLWGAVIGLALSAPVFALYRPVLADADSTRVVAVSFEVWRNGLDYLIETQDVFLPNLLIAPIVRLGGIGAAKAYVLLTLVALTGVTTYLTWWISRSLLASAGTALALLSMGAFLDQAFRLSLYFIALSCGYLGVWMAYRAINATSSRWKFSVPAGLLLVLSAEAHGVGQLFLVAPVLLLILSFSKKSILSLGRTYAVAAIAYIPRVVVNLSQGGISHFRSNRTDYWITKGYLRTINESFFGSPLRESTPDYLAAIPGEAYMAFTVTGMLAAVVALLAWVLLSNRRAQLFSACALLLFVAAVVISKPPLFPRYFTPIMPGVALLAGLVVSQGPRRSSFPRWPVVLIMTTLAVSAGLSLSKAYDRAQASEREVQAKPFHELANHIEPGDRVIGARAHQLLFVRYDITPFGGIFLTEKEFLTYLTWPGDEEVIAMLERRGITWALVVVPRLLEVEYHESWIRPAYGLEVRHVEALESSSNFCKVTELQGYRLYKLGPC